LLPPFVLVGAMVIEVALFVFAKQFWIITGVKPQSKTSFFIIRNAFIIKLIGYCFLGLGLGVELDVWIQNRRFASDGINSISLAVGLMIGLLLVKGLSHTSFIKNLER